MPDRVRSRGRRTPTQSAADQWADDVARHLGRGLLDARQTRRFTQVKGAKTAFRGGRLAHPERAIDLDPGRSRAADILLVRGTQLALTEVFDWLPDGGEAFRSWDRRLAKVADRAVALAHSDAEAAMIAAAGIWVLRATRANRRLVSDHRVIFRARFLASAAAWLAALERPDSPAPRAPGLVWISVKGDQLIPARLG
jgi:hypothetical protein